MRPLEIAITDLVGDEWRLSHIPPDRKCRPQVRDVRVRDGETRDIPFSIRAACRHGWRRRAFARYGIVFSGDTPHVMAVWFVEDGE